MEENEVVGDKKIIITNVKLEVLGIIECGIYVLVQRHWMCACVLVIIRYIFGQSVFPGTLSVKCVNERRGKDVCVLEGIETLFLL